MSSEQFDGFNLDMFVLRCERCNKPFDREASLKRHRYYCRSKSSTAAPTSRRNHACSACAKKKWRCDLRKPDCSRCLSSGITCHYSRSQSPERKSRKQSSVSIPTTATTTTTVSPPGAEQPQVDGVVVAEDVLAMGLDTTIDWDNMDFNLASGGSEYFDVGDLGLSSKEGPLIYQPPTSFYQPLLNDNPLKHQGLLELSLGTTMPMSLLPNLTLVPRSQASPEAQKIATLLLFNLKSYPQVIIQGRGLPPFIHSTILAKRADSSDDPFHNCVRLLRMIDGQAAGKRSLFWRCVKSECEHILGTLTTLTKMELMSALQAVITYLLVLITENPVETPQIAAILHASTCYIGAELGRRSFCTTDGCRPGESTSEDPKEQWEAWLLDESKRRVRTVAMIINMLFYFDPATVCTMFTHLLLGPLPSKRQLWDANNEIVWSSEIERLKIDYNDYGLAPNGQLVVMKVEPTETCGQAHARLLQDAATRKSLADTAGNWDEWCTGMDGFGSLIMLAALLGQ